MDKIVNISSDLKYGFQPIYQIYDKFKKGDVIRFTTKSGVPTQLGTKVYVLTADADTNGSGQTTLNFEPGLIEDIADDTDVETNDVQFTVFKVSPASEF